MECAVQAHFPFRQDIALFRTLPEDMRVFPFMKAARLPLLALSDCEC